MNLLISNFVNFRWLCSEKSTSTWSWDYDGHTMTYKGGERIRFQVKSVTFAPRVGNSTHCSRFFTRVFGDCRIAVRGLSVCTCEAISCSLRCIRFELLLQYSRNTATSGTFRFIYSVNVKWQGIVRRIEREMASRSAQQRERREYSDTRALKRREYPCILKMVADLTKRALMSWNICVLHDSSSVLWNSWRPYSQTVRDIFWTRTKGSNPNQRKQRRI